MTGKKIKETAPSKGQSAGAGEAQGLHEAKFYRKLPGGIAQCRLCNRFCAIKPGEVGLCRVRKNVAGTLYSLVYGRTLTLSIDPVEKKPLFHFRPGTTCLGISTFGCNFRCPFCQNWQISQAFDSALIAQVPYMSPGEIVEKTLAEGVPGIAYTYTEPTVFAEYALDTMKIARKRGLYNVWVSNGYTTKEALDEIIPYMDAINIDLKGNEKFYDELCYKVNRGKVLENIRYLNSKGVHVEVTNLVVPGSNDSGSDFKEVAEFIASVNPDMPLHFTRFFPNWKMIDALPTPASALERAKGIAEKAGLSYVYIGNIAGEEPTFCKKCRALLVRRIGFVSEVVGLKGRKCAKCGTGNNFVV